MKKCLVCFVAVVMTVVLLPVDAEARRGKPPILLQEIQPDFASMAHLDLPTPNIEKILEREELAALNGRFGGPMRVAETIEVGKSMSELGTWERLADGSRVWRLRVSATGAFFLAFQLSDFELPRWATMHFISAERDYYDGPYTIRNNNDAFVFGSPMVPGDSAVIEVHVPAKTAFLPDFTIDSVSFGYKNFRNILRVPFRDGRPLAQTFSKIAADPVRKAGCEIGVNCPEGAGWELQKRSEAEAFDGNFICSGSVLNTTRNDCSVYNYMTANHCFSSGKAKRLVFFWNYEDSSCGAGDASIDQTTTGSTHIAGGNASDFFLVSLNEVPPEGFFVSQSGWDATGNQPLSGTTIGHPNDRPKEIALEFDPVTNGEQSGWGTDHWRVNGWDIGGTEGGSSGGSLWDQNQRMVGQLHGGTAVCGDGWDEFGKMSVSFAVSDVAAALDPDNTGALVTDGIDCFGGEPPPPPPPCELGVPGDPCTEDSECCSGNCKGKPGSRTCGN